jgi:predicted N-acetyltransferase YhbS
MTSMHVACADQSVSFSNPSLTLVETIVHIRDERAGDLAARDALLDRAIGAHRRRKTSERLREGRHPARDLALVAMDGDRVVGTVRLWSVDAGGAPALLLGPLAVAETHRSLGLGARLICEAMFRAVQRGHKAIILVGDAAYYERFGFSRSATRSLSLPGPVESERFLGLELEVGALEGASGLVTPIGERVEAIEDLRAA